MCKFRVEAHRATRVHQGQAFLDPIRPWNPTSRRCPAHSGFLAGRVRVGSGFSGRADKSNHNEILSGDVGHQ